MADYKKIYLQLFHTYTDALGEIRKLYEILYLLERRFQDAQAAAEEIFLETDGQPPETANKTE